MPARNFAKILSLLTALALAPKPAALAADYPELKTGPEAAALAWIRFDDAGESYAGLPYLWLGKANINPRIDVAPQAGHVLAVLWGCKSDRRDAIALINGKQVSCSLGGYDGCRWLLVDVPDGIAGPRYEITFQRARQKPAFIAAVALVGPGQSRPAPGGEPAMQSPAHKISLSLSPPGVGSVPVL